MGNFKEILDSVEFGVIKEYMEVGGTDEGISSVTGLSRKVIASVREAPHYKAWLENLKVVHRNKIRSVPQESEEIDAIRQARIDEWQRFLHGDTLPAVIETVYELYVKERLATLQKGQDNA